jgi:hypothetical protein
VPECRSHPGNLEPGCRWCRAGITDDTRGRLVTRVADMITAPTLGAVMDVCAICCRAVFVDRVATPDPPDVILTLVCTVCAMKNPDTRPQVARLMMIAMRLGGALPPARKRPWHG